MIRDSIGLPNQEVATGFFKNILPASMSLDDKLDEIYDMHGDDLNYLLIASQEQEDYELCNAIQKILSERQT